MKCKSLLRALVFSACATGAAGAAWADVVQIKEAWIRAAVPGQSGTGAFMTLTSSKPVRLVGLSTAVAGVAEVHEMKMDGGVMRMRALPDGLALPAGQAVELKPGGYHLMLMDLKAPLVAGSRVALSLQFKDEGGAVFSQSLELPVGQAAPGAVPQQSQHQHQRQDQHQHQH